MKLAVVSGTRFVWLGKMWFAFKCTSITVGSLVPLASSSAPVACERLNRIEGIGVTKYVSGCAADVACL